jgi:sialic acid synthase SpsE
MKTRIIAEIGYNHNGSMDLAKEMIDEARKLNVWSVKFQKWDIEGFPENIKNQIRNKPEIDYGQTYYEHRKFLEFSIEQLTELKQYAERQGLEFVCSGKDLNSLNALMGLNLKYIKLPSQRYLDNEIFKFLSYYKQGLKIIVSTGMLNGKEIKKSKWIKEADILMHCISLYPAWLNQTDLAWMRAAPYNGYSSHETEGKAIKYAVCLGAEYIERHFTLDKNMKGSDHSISSDVKEMKRIIKEVKEVEMMLGDGNRNITNDEIKLGQYYRGF